MSNRLRIPGAGLARLGFTAQFLAKPVLGIVLMFARVKGHVRDTLTRAGLADRFGPESFYPTIEGGVAAYLNGKGSERPHRAMQSPRNEG